MNDAQIDLDEEKVSFDGSWYTAESLAAKITEMLSAKDFRIGKAGAALEALQAALADAKSLTVRLPGSLLTAVEATAKETDRSVGELVREALVRVVGGDLPAADGATAAEAPTGPRPAPEGVQPVPVAANADSVTAEEAENAVPLASKKKDEPNPADMEASSWFDRDPQS